MKLTILTETTSETNSNFTTNLEETIANLKQNDCEVELFNVNDCNINPCVGCFSCWVKTPGVCIYAKDDMTSILKSQISSDWVIFIAPVIAGTISYKTKVAIDRSLSTLMPYIGIYSGECHHLKRYDNYPNRAMLILDDENATDEAIRILDEISKKNALNAHAKREIVKRVNADNIKENLNEIINS